MVLRQLSSLDTRTGHGEAPIPETTNHVVHFHTVGGGKRPSPRSGHAMITCIHLNAIFLFGGLGYDVDFRNDMWRMDLETMKWSPVVMQRKRGATMPPPVFGQGHVLMADDRRWFMYGGLGRRHDEHLSSVHLFDLDECAWLPMSPPVLRPLWGHSISSVQDAEGRERLVIFGGMEHDSVNDDLYVLDGATLRLEETRSVLKSETSVLFAQNDATAMKLRRRHGVCVYKGVFVMVACGRNLTTFLNDMWCYNFLLDLWVPLTQAASRSSVEAFFAHPTQRIFGERLIVEYLDVIPASGRAALDFFSTMSPRTGVSMFLRGNLVYVFGGFSWRLEGSCSFNDLHVYDIENHCWFQASTHVEAGMHVGEEEAGPLLQRASPKRRGVTPTTMAAICPVPPTASRGDTWFMFGGRWGNVPLAHQFTLACQEPRYPLRVLAALWLSRSARDTWIQAAVGSNVPSACRKLIATARSLVRFTPADHAILLPRGHDESEWDGVEFMEEESDEDFFDPDSDLSE